MNFLDIGLFIPICINENFHLILLTLVLIQNINYIVVWKLVEVYHCIIIYTYLLFTTKV